VETVPVVLSSRTGAGDVLRETYAGWSGSEMDLLERGLISSGILDGPKSRVLLTFLLGAGKHRDEVASAFARRGLYAES
jgi:L-asparaginase